MGNITNKNYFIINGLIPKYNGFSKGFLTLYYLSFKDEISCNIQMAFRQVRIENIKNKDQFNNFLKNHKLYNLADKMIDIDILSYWNEIVREIVRECNDIDLIHELDIKNLDEFLTKTSLFIKKAGREYKRRLSKIFI